MESGLKRKNIDESCDSKKRYMESLGSIDESPRILKGIKSCKGKILKAVPQTLFKGFFGKENMQKRSLFAIKNKKGFSKTSIKKIFDRKFDSEKKHISDNQSELDDKENSFCVSDMYCKTMQKNDKEVMFIEKNMNIDKILEISSDYSSQYSKDDLIPISLF
ncbi:hypothetical protein SteCoe_7567 [Stentor coeruleus]|uniref:Uncharacterized protein n=1 Tax=Stentor coeruleus TaxID=5963 RepID=A0A1R2CMF5_9CILI|nr:hypothetical protein SteCoe_7567 [Stentor coeruleus]